jgi:hypothetical protein
MFTVFNISILPDLLISLHNFYNLIVEHVDLLYIFEGTIIGSIILLSAGKGFGKKVVDAAIKTVQFGAGATVIATGYNTGFGSKLKPSSNSGESNNNDNTSGNNTSGNNTSGDNTNNNSSGNDNKSN